MADLSKALFDVVVVGSGASGGWACKRLAEAGLSVALVDAGRPRTDQDYREHTPRFALKFRDLVPEAIAKSRPIQVVACNEWNFDWFASDLEEPYTTPAGMPFQWLGRVRLTGGRTNVWGRHTYRFSDLDFKAASHDGVGDDWPLTYADLAPYYDLVEEYVGISGEPAGLAQLPDGRFQPPMGLNCAEWLLRNRVKEKLHWTVTQCRIANLTRPLHGRAPCHYCGPCHNGCATRSVFNAAYTTVADALRTGRCTHVPHAMVYKVLMDSERPRAQGVLYIDRITRQPREVRGRVVVLCAQALESVRILFNSADQHFPNGLANRSGVLGHYLMDHVMGGGATGEFPQFPVRPTVNGPRRPEDEGGLYTPRFRNLPDQPRSSFLRGYGFQSWGDRPRPNLSAAGFGEEYKARVMEAQPTRLSLIGFGECLPRRENYVEIDPNCVDAFGIPVLRIHMQFGENEHALIDDMALTASQMLEAAGAKNIRPFAHHDPTMGAGFHATPGRAIHEVGVARMGTDPRRSVLNAFQQCHDVKNLYVMDGAGFVSSACQNPTLTIMALCVRSCDYLMAEMKRGNI